MWKKILSSSILLSILFLSSCLKTNERKVVNSLKLDFQEGDLPSLHPHDLMIYLRGISVAKTLFEGLTRIDSHGNVQLAGAQSVHVSPDKLQYTFILRDNAWTNGKPVTAYQYEGAWKEALSPISNCSRADLLYMIKNAAQAKKNEMALDSVGVKALDEKTLLVELEYPSPYFLELLSQPICLPLLDAKNKTQTEFNGPFAVHSWEKNSRLQLKPNPHFWNRKNVSLAEIDIYMIQDLSTAFSLYEKEKLDWVGLPLCPLSTDLITHLKKKNELRSHPIDRAFWVFLNTKHLPLSSSSIRQALSSILDRQAITNHILVGGNPLDKPIPHALLDSSIQPTTLDAKTLFNQGLSELGMSLESFPPLVITYSQQANRKQLAEYLKETWTKAFGIEVQLEPQEWNVLRTNLAKGQFEISGCFEAAFYKDPLELLDRLTTLNPCNFSQWTNPVYANKVHTAMHEKNPQERIKILSEAEAILSNAMPFIPICSDQFLFTHHPDLKGYAFDYVGAIDFSYATF